MKRFLALILVVLMVISIVPTITSYAQSSTEFQTIEGVTYYFVDGIQSTDTTLVKNEAGEWVYINNGVFDQTVTTLCLYNGNYFYVKDGKVDFTATLLYKFENKWYYINKGKHDTASTTLCQYGNNLCYIKNGTLQKNVTTLCKYNNAWYYVSKAGKVDFTYTGLVKYNDRYFYVNKGIVDFSATTLCKYNGSWWYVKKGELDFNATLLYKYGNSYYYVRNGKVYNTYTGLKYYNGSWYYIKKGVWNKATTLCKYNGYWYYVENGIVKFSANKSFKYGKTTYKIKNGVAQVKGMKGTGVSNIGKVVANVGAETFDGTVTNTGADDYTRPTNSYLPKGTVDVIKGNQTLKVGTEKVYYYKLKYGKRVYVSKLTTPGKVRKTVTSKSVGLLPGSNEIAVESVKETAKNTNITLYSLYKAPFSVSMLPQTYTNPKKQDYTINSQTFTYVEIKLFYTTSFKGTINFSSDNPVFSKATVTKSGKNTIMRLYLKTKGKFYGWDANYDTNGNLVFSFLNPSKATKTTDNSYGASLKNIKILIDVGHGGIDPGALGKDSKNHPESERNLNLAKLLKAELVKMGATVYMTRSDDTTMTSDARVEYFKKVKPDYCIAIHHDSSTKSSVNGLGVFYGSPLSRDAAKLIYDSSIATNLYKGDNMNRLSWHYFYMTRMTYCPTVLTENGFISGTKDYNNIKNAAANKKKAVALAKGIAKYFLSN